MALIRLGGLVTQISGKIGGQTLGTSASGSYIKNSGTPRKSITLSQRSKMSAMSATAQQWRSLTQGQRDVFNAASPEYPYLSRVGETKYYSGYAIFGQLRNNGLNVSFGGLPIPLPRVTFAPIVYEDEGAPLSELFLQFTGGVSGVMYRVFVSGPVSKGVSSPYRNMFFVGQSLGNTGGSTSINFDAGWYGKFGGIPATGKFYWRIDGISVSTGQKLKGMLSGVTTW